MAMTSYEAAPPVCPPVVSPLYCVPYSVDLVVAEKVISFSDRSLVVTDTIGNVFFKVKGVLVSLRDQRLLLDASDNPVLRMQEKIRTAHKRWLVFRGDGKDEKDLLFSVRKSALFQFRTELDVFLAGNTSENACDFRIKGSLIRRSCTIYLGDTDTIVAQMKRQYNVMNFVLEKDAYVVTMYPNVDHAFIVALIVILNAIKQESKE